MKKTTSLTFGLFTISPKHPFCWLKYTSKEIKILFRRIRFLLKHGYNEPALWESFEYFIDQWEEILTSYRYERSGTPVVINIQDYPDGNWDEENEKAFNEILDRMLVNLKIMRNEDHVLGGGDWDKVLVAKDEFFADFSKHFYSFWD